MYDLLYEESPRKTCCPVANELCGKNKSDLPSRIVDKRLVIVVGWQAQDLKDISDIGGSVEASKGDIGHDGDQDVLLLVKGSWVQSEGQRPKWDFRLGKHLGHEETAREGEELDEVRVDADTGVAQREELIDTGSQNGKDGSQDPDTERVDGRSGVIGRVDHGSHLWVGRVVDCKVLLVMEFLNELTSVLMVGLSILIVDGLLGADEQVLGKIEVELVLLVQDAKLGKNILLCLAVIQRDVGVVGAGLDGQLLFVIEAGRPGRDPGNVDVLLLSHDDGQVCKPEDLDLLLTLVLLLENEIKGRRPMKVPAHGQEVGGGGERQERGGKSSRMV